MWGNHVALEVDGELVLGVITRPVGAALVGDERHRRVPHRRRRRRAAAALGFDHH